VNALYVTYCSANKKPVEGSSPEELYDSPRITSFITWCESKRYNWAILSAKYGLFFPYEVHKNYNVTFKTVAYKCRVVENDDILSYVESQRRLSLLIAQVRQQVLDKNIERVFFYFEQPLQRRKCYLSILHAGVDSCEIEHDTSDELRKHIAEMVSDGTGRIKMLDVFLNERENDHSPL
jgi:hypothetical protein